MIKKDKEEEEWERLLKKAGITPGKPTKDFPKEEEKKDSKTHHVMRLG